MGQSREQGVNGKEDKFKGGLGSNQRVGMRVDRVELAMERERRSGAEERRACVMWQLEEKLDLQREIFLLAF